jgi:hypothetical protein
MALRMGYRTKGRGNQVQWHDSIKEFIRGAFPDTSAAEPGVDVPPMDPAYLAALQNEENPSDVDISRWMQVLRRVYE